MRITRIDEENQQKVGLEFPIQVFGRQCEHRSVSDDVILNDFICTRPAGHSGIHVAHVGNNRAIFTWFDDDPPAVTADMITRHDLRAWMDQLPWDVKIGIEPGGAALIAIDLHSNVYSLPIGEIKDPDADVDPADQSWPAVGGEKTTWHEGNQSSMSAGGEEISIDELRDRS